MELGDTRPEVVVVDDVLADPDFVREIGLKQDFIKMGSQGLRSTQKFAAPELQELFSRLLGRRVVKWDYEVNGRFQFCTAEDKIVFHSDEQTHAATLFLTPNAPLEAGVTLYRSRVTGDRYPHPDPAVQHRMFVNNLFDASKWEPLDRIANVYNRLVVWPGRHVHAATSYFGHDLHTARLFLIFFFDCE